MTNFKLILIKVVFIAIFVQFAIPFYSQTCTRGVIDCTGLCGRFTDKDGDGICDFSPRSTPEKTDKDAKAEAKVTEAKAASLSEHKTTAKGDAAKTKEALASKAGNVKETSKAEKEKTVTSTVEPGKGAAQEVVAQDSSVSNSPETTTAIDTAKVQPQMEKTPHKQKQAYPLLEICALTLGLYFVSVLLVKFHLWKKQTHRKVWNVVLLITFLMSGVLGFFLVVQLNYHIAMSWIHSFMELHVLFGIAMAIVSVIHVLWHLKYYVNMFGRNKG